MAVDPVESRDPSSDPLANYDYQKDGQNQSGISADLDQLIEGDVRFDEYSREMYATDASAYEVVPIGVVFPRSTNDVARVMRYCAAQSIPVLPRGGGTSLAGQSVNEAVVLDFTRYMNEIRQVRPDEARAVAQAGAYLGDINAVLEEFGLKFAPDPAWSDKSALGGAIGNNSTGSHSLKYGKTDVYLESAEVVLADGTITEFGEMSVDELREQSGSESLESRIYAEIVRIIDHDAPLIEERYPTLKRNASGYNLDRLIEEASDGTVNLARVLAGSEGTLAIVTEAEISLEPIPNTKAVVLLTYRSLNEAMEDVAPVLGHEPAAVEVMDNVLLDLARQTEEFGDVVELLPDGTDSVLLVEFYADSDADGRQKAAALIADRVADGTASVDPPRESLQVDAPRYAVDSMEAHDQASRDTFWKMRKSGLPILLSRTSDEKHIAFIEDCAVPPESLPEYVSAFRSVLRDHGTSASFYAHAGPGVLHVRPLINTKTVEGIEEMESIADAVTDLIVEYGGSVSGEHGDGRARTQWNRKLYGEELWETFRSLKSAFDKEWLLNPGQVCGEVSLTSNLRFSPSYEFSSGFEPALEWPIDNGFQGMTELCHGCGGCRGPQETTGGVMCPTFRASREEITSTRGRANMLRQAMSGGLERDELFSEEFIQEVLDLCIGCKGCARDCPSEVDMAKLKVEVLNEYHRRNGVSLRDRVFADIDRLSALASRMTPVANWGMRVPGARWALDRTIGISRKRELPAFRSKSFESWFETDHTPRIADRDHARKAVLLPDTFTNYNYPAVGKSSVRVLEEAGVQVHVPRGMSDSGRPAFSKGFIEKARRRARTTVDSLAPLVADGWDVVAIEPSDAVMIQSDYADLLTDDAAKSVMANTYGLCEYLDTTGILDGLEFHSVDETVTYHGHCHQKATKRAGHAARVLERAGYRVDQLDSGCCGMAGSFGYESEHYSMSMAIARILFGQVAESTGEAVTAPGMSCRSQLREYLDTVPPHPIELVASAVERTT